MRQVVRGEQAEMAASALCLHAPRLPQHPLDSRGLEEHTTRQLHALVCCQMMNR